MLRPDELLARYDREMRIDPAPEPGVRVERLDRLVRLLGDDNYVIYSDLTREDAPRVVAEQAEFFRRSGAALEWKTFGHDRPPTLGATLAAAGFVPGELETLVVLDLERTVPTGARAAGVEVRQMTDRAGAREAARTHEAVHGPDDSPRSARWEEWVSDPRVGLFVAYVDGRPVALGRISMPEGRSFAGLWGGGTAPAYRHRGVYRSLVAARATLARQRGYRFLTVDALETSRPILERLGFVPLTTTRGWVLRPGTGLGTPR
ncbi:MAG: GNAT family N-acetyltransferase [Thermoplasmata archaeon]